MSNEQEDDLRDENQALRDRISSIDAEGGPLRALQLENAVAAETKIGQANRGELLVEDSTLRDFDEAEKELNERFRKAGASGSSAHIKAGNDFQTKKAESLAAIREGRLTNLQQNAVSQSGRLQNLLTGSRNTASTILSSIQGSQGQSGFSRRNLQNQFFQGVGGSIGRSIAGSKFIGDIGTATGKGVKSIGSSIFGAGKSALQKIFS